MAEESPVKIEAKPEKAVVTLQYADTKPTEETGAHLIDLDGVFETISTTPTGAPRDVYGQVKINSADGSICFYDTANGVWRCVRNGYVGAFDSAGATGTPFPTGWSLNKTGTGSYVITHNLGTASYAVVATPLGAYNIVQVASRGSTSFEILAVDRATGALANTGMNFILTLS